MSDFFTFSIRTGKHLQRDWIQRPTIKIILSLLGASGVGKTCLALCLRHGRLPENLRHTSSSCGIESHFYYLDRLFQNNYVVDIHLKDPPGQDKYEAVTNDIFRLCHGALLLADTTKIDTLERLEQYWYTKLENMALNNVQSVLVCTKIDLFEKKNQEYRQSFLQRAENFASLHQIPMIQVSAYRNNVEHIFKQLIVRILGDETITNDLISKATIPGDLINQRRNTMTHSNLTPLGYSTSDPTPLGYSTSDLHRPRKCCH
jgi:GTPase SAR1 family protein